MKAVCLCGGNGSRLQILTKITNKHLLPVYDKPMIFYSIELMVKSGITDILLVCGGNDAGEFLRILGNGEQFGLKHLHYTYQSEPRGIADALGLAEEWAQGEPVTVLLADNIFENDFKSSVDKFEQNPTGAMIFGTKVEHPEHYGVIVQENGQIKDIIEKPRNPSSNLIATGLYIYDEQVWSFIKQLTPSQRGELEVTDINKHYLKKGQLSVEMVNGYWADCGESLDGYLDACIKARQMRH